MSRPVSTKVLRWVIICGYTVWYVTSHSGQLKLPTAAGW